MPHQDLQGMCDRFVNVNISSSVRSKRFWSPYRILDKGLLEASQRGLKFQGQFESFEINRITQFRMIRADFRWRDYVSVIFFLLFVLFLASVSAWYLKIDNGTELRSIITAVVFGGLFIYSFFALILHILDRWILVEYIDKNGEAKEVCISRWGDFGIFSNSTKDMFEKINNRF